MSYQNGGGGGDQDEKLFVGGISAETTQQELHDYFSKFGTVSKTILKMDANTGRSRGFGFICFEDKDVISTVLASEHMLNGRKIDPKRAKGRPGREPQKKAFVGGLDPDTSEDEIRSVLSTFGPVESIEWPYDKVNSKKRPYCFVTFETEDACSTSVNAGKQTINGRECDIKRATPKTEEGGAGAGRGGFVSGYGGRGGRGGGGGWGGYTGYGYDGYGGGYGGGYGAYDYNSYYGGGYGSPGYGTGYGDYSAWYGYGDQSGYGGYGDQGGYKSGAAAGGGGGGGGRGGYHPYHK